ncbi:hypothetical protein ABIC83_002922 [Roseateles asaccharophilus]|uniref:hypothetical protein n=1 Tax=Roseateles asaccharophilus TaxID=582607 RepID=UPI0038356435
MTAPSSYIALWHYAVNRRSHKGVDPIERLEYPLDLSTGRFNAARFGSLPMVVSLDPATRWLEDVKVSPNVILDFAKGLRGLRNRRHILNVLESLARRASDEGQNLSLDLAYTVPGNFGALVKPMHGAITDFIIDQGADASLNPTFPTWVKVFNPKVVRKVRLLSNTSVASVAQELGAVRQQQAALLPSK